MNLDRVSTPLTSAGVRPEGQRLDVTLSERAVPGKSIQKAVSQPEIGSILGVLTNDENRAIQALFVSKQGTYDPDGESPPATVPGTHLDLKA